MEKELKDSEELVSSSKVDEEVEEMDQEIEEEYVQEPLFEEDVKKIKDAIEVLCAKYPIAEKLKNMEIKADDFSGNISTNGSELFVQPEFLQETSKENLGWALMYIANVIDLGLIQLQKEIDAEDRMKFSVAACYLINNIITAYNDPDLEILKGSIFDPEYSGKTIMEIYDLVDLNNLKTAK
jgi:hypothetical protein